MMEVLDGTHATDRLQISVIEGKDRYQTFSYHVRQVSAGNYEAVNGLTGLIQFTGTDFGVIMNSVIGQLPAPTNNPIGVILVTGTALDCASVTININKPCIIDGRGSAWIRKTASYTGDPAGAVFRINSSDVQIKDLVIEDTAGAAQTNTKIIASTGSGIDSVVQERILIENVRIKNAYFQAISLDATNQTRLIKAVRIRNVWVDTTTTDDAIFLSKGVTDCTIEHCMIYEPGLNGISIKGTKEYIKLVGNNIWKTQAIHPGGFGIYVSNYPSTTNANPGACKEVVIRDNQISEYLSNNGIRITADAEKVIIANNFIKGAQSEGINIVGTTLSGTIYRAKEVMILNNIVRDDGGVGIAVGSDASITFQGFEISGNYVRATQSNAIQLSANVNYAIITKNMIYDFGKDGSANRAGILLDSSSNNVVTDNSIYWETVGGATTPHTIRESGTSDNNIIANNSVFGQPITPAGTTTIVSKNRGFKTEASGTANITSGNTSVVVTHGLGYTPTLQHIQVTPTTTWGSMTKFWISTPTSTQFTINGTPDPAATVTFAWQVIRRN